MILRTNVKLNLGLNVLRKRPDGYHDIETLFVPCHEFGDTLEVITGDDYSRTSAALFAHYSSRPFDDAPESTVEHRQDLCRPLTLRFPPSHLVGETSSTSLGLASVTRLGREAQGDKGLVDANNLGGHTLKQAISEDGKLMITIARAEGVDWNPLEDLCTKAYRLLDQDHNLPPVKIFLEKTAPVGAGLGGGSADAAFTLKALNELCGLGLTQEKLSEYASRLGSDCAFFICNRPMIGTGRGEILEPFDVDFSEYKLQVLVPEGVCVSTAEAYKGIVPRDQRNAEEEFGHENEAFVPNSEKKELLGTEQVFSCQKTKGKDGQGLKKALCRPIAEWKDAVVNDFEATVFKAHPELAAIKRSLYDSGAVYASMSGSGSALFALYRLDD